MTTPTTPIVSWFERWRLTEVLTGAGLMLAALLLLMGPHGKDKLAPATETSTTLNYKVGQSGWTWLNNATQVTLSSTEQNIVIQVQPGYPVTVQFAPPASGGNSWTYSTVTGASTQTTAVAAGQNLVLKFGGTTTLYLVSASGVTLSISALDYSIRAQ